jgi:hypothetical protein
MDLRSRAEEHSGEPVVLLDGLNTQTEKADQGLVLYTEAMAAEDDALLAGVPVDSGEQGPGQAPEPAIAAERP